MQKFKKAQNRTKFCFELSWFARRPPRMKTKCKTSKRLKIVQSSFLGFLGSLAGHTPDEGKMQKFKKAQNRTKFCFELSWFARRPPRMKSECKTTKRLKIVQSSVLSFLGSLAGHRG
jgi:hypothetical protein